VLAQVDALDSLTRAREKRVAQRARLAAQRDDGAVVIGVGMNVEQLGATGGERVCDLGDRDDVPPLRDVGDGEEHGVQRTKLPASSTRVPPTVSDASTTTTSRCTG